MEHIDFRLLAHCIVLFYFFFNRNEVAKKLSTKFKTDPVFLLWFELWGVLPTHRHAVLQKWVYVLSE